MAMAITMRMVAGGPEFFFATEVEVTQGPLLSV
jgi:hypothetical protein